MSTKIRKIVELVAEAESEITKDAQLSKDLGDLLPRYESRSGCPDSAEHVQALEEFAQAEVDANFPYLSGVLAVRMWSALEGLVDDVARETIRLEPSRVDCSVLGKIRVSLDDVMQLDVLTAPGYVLSKLKEGIGTRGHRGVARFEALLSAVGLGGAVEEGVKRAFFELVEIRNAVVHASGRADARLCGALPWLGLSAGQPIPVTSSDNAYYWQAAGWYCIELILRVSPNRLADYPDKRSLFVGLQNHNLNNIRKLRPGSAGADVAN